MKTLFSLSQENPFHTKEHCLKLLRAVHLTRAIDDKTFKLARQNKGGTFHVPVAGHELIGALCALSLTPEKDWGFPYYRDRGFPVGLGSTAEELIGAFLAKDVPHHSGGRMMPDHFSHKKLRIPCQSSCVGSQYLQAVGCAKALKIDGRDEIVYVSGGDGSTSQGDFHEALNFACIHRLNIIFVVQDNGWAISVPKEEQTAGGTIAKIAVGYEGLSVHQVDGTNLIEMSEALTKAVAKGRNDEGPSVIVADVPRLGAHSSSDDPKKYQSSEEEIKDPIAALEQQLIELDVIDRVGIEKIREEIFQEVEKASDTAETFSEPDPKTIEEHIFKEAPTITEEEKESDKPSIVMIDAINHALDEEMSKDEKVIVFGQDVAHGKGGVFGATRHLTEKYSVERCFNTPLAESTIIGLAIGMSFVEGFKPVAEIQFADYVWTGVNQLLNELPSIHYRSNGEWNCPVVIRIPCGAYIQGGPYHSQSIEGFFAHCPGLKIVVPSNAADAKRLLKAAIEDPNPVVFFEHKGLYRQRYFSARPEPESDEMLPLGKAHIVRKGADLTLVTWGMGVVMGMEVSEKLAKEGIDVEVIDLRTIAPLDMETISASVRKTGKVLIAHEASLHGGFGGEIAARIAKEDFHYLDAPIQRLGAKDCPVSYNKGLENAMLPQTTDFEKALRQLASY